MSGPDRLAAAYLASDRLLTKLARAAKAVQDGVVLGLVDRDVLHALDQRFYARKTKYLEEDYNRSGLYPWESRVLDEHFAGVRRVLVTSAGGGREVLALRRRGLEAVGFEPNEAMVSAGNALLEAESGSTGLVLAPRDGWPDLPGPYDGVVIGWGSIMHVQGRAERVRFLAEARRRLEPGAPLLVSFFVFDAGHSYYRRVARVGTVLRRLRGRPPVDLGDSLVPAYFHAYTRDTITDELAEAGFELVDYRPEPYGHALARAATGGAHRGAEEEELHG